MVEISLWGMAVHNLLQKGPRRLECGSVVRTLKCQGSDAWNQETGVLKAVAEACLTVEPRSMFNCCIPCIELWDYPGTWSVITNVYSIIAAGSAPGSLSSAESGVAL